MAIQHHMKNNVATIHATRGAGRGQPGMYVLMPTGEGQARQASHTVSIKCFKASCLGDQGKGIQCQVYA